MDTLLLLKALILGIVEGLTEFLPISSTGHLILAGDLLDFNDDRGKLFEIVIQSGAILAVVWEYRTRIAGVITGLGRDRLANRLVLNLAIAFLPLAILGLLFKKVIEANLFKPVPVALAFIIGAFVILWAERREHRIRVETVDDMSPLDALKLGIAQAFALIPGTSRSGATIIGGLLFGLSRKAATEFSFFLAIPTLFAATLYNLYKERALLNADDLGMWAVGFIASFVSAFLCVRWLLRYISSHDFTAFAWYPPGLRRRGPAHRPLRLGPMDRRVIVYLHGFCSSPASWKVGLLRNHVAARCPDIELIAPALSPVPAQAMADVEAILAGLRAPVTFMGSSLGGHYATYLAEKHGRPAAIINPAVIRRLEPGRFIGEHENFHSGERFRLTREHAEQLDAQWVPHPHPGPLSGAARRRGRSAGLPPRRGPLRRQPADRPARWRPQLHALSRISRPTD